MQRQQHQIINVWPGSAGWTKDKAAAALNDLLNLADDCLASCEKAKAAADKQGQATPVSWQLRTSLAEVTLLPARSGCMRLLRRRA